MKFVFGQSLNINRLSLAQRLLIGALVWSIVVVVGGALAIASVYRAEALSLLEEELETTLVSLSRAVDVADDGDLGAIDQALPQDRGSILFTNGVGPYEEPIRTAVQAITLSEIDSPVLLVASADRSSANEGASRLRTTLVLAMITLAGGTIIAMAVGLRMALRPFNRIQSDIADVREGRRANLRDDYPIEVQPLSEELNKLLSHNRSVVQRARTHVGNLAHALKTPLAVLRNEASDNSQLADTVLRQTNAMHENVQHYLNRARAAARAETLGTRTVVADSTSGLVRMMNRLYEVDGKSVSADLNPNLAARIEKQDLDEVLGNLVDNACKWAGSKVVISTETVEPQMLLIHVDDDGPGLTVEQRSEAVRRGVRLDETAPGSGLGLSIVADLVEMNGGGLVLTESPLGGLRATVKLGRTG